MSLDAVIADVYYQDDGTAVLKLAGPVAGPRQLLVLSPPRFLEAAIGTAIWGDHNDILVGQTVWAERVGHGAIRLVPKKEAAP